MDCIYRSPSTVVDVSISSLCSLLEELNGFTHLLICGHFNMKDINWSNMSVNPRNTYIRGIFLDSVQDLSLFQHVQEPTCFRPDTAPSLLDLVFTNEVNMIKDINYLPGLGNSDHVCIHFSFSCYTTFKPKYAPRYNANKANYDNMCASLHTIDWLGSMNVMNTEDAWRFFKTVLQDVIDKYVPLTQVTKKRNIYMSPEAFRLRKLK